MIWKSPNGAGVLANHKVFSTEIAQRIGDRKLLDNLPPRFRGRIHSTIPLFETLAPLHLLVADPVAKFYAACREDCVKPWAALVKIKSRRLGTHFEHQSRLLHVPNVVHLYRAPDHVAVFFEVTGLGDPPQIYTKENPGDLDDEIRSVYAADQALFDSIHSPGQKADKSTLPPLTKQFRTVAAAAARFVRRGAPTTPPDIIAARDATCRACDQWDASALNGTGRCRKCGCSTWAKLRMATEHCPLGKWEALPAAP